MKRSTYVMAFLAYVLPTFPLGYFWHLTFFKDYYRSLEVYRDDILIPFGIVSMIVQGVIWVQVYSRLFAGESVMRGAIKFAALAAPLAWTYCVIVIAAKHHMASVSGFVMIETAFVAAQYIVVSPLIAWAFACGGAKETEHGV